MTSTPIREQDMEFMQPFTRGDGKPVKRIMELGAKQTKGVSYKSYFEAQGFDHVSIDLNGHHGALRRDLNVKLWHKFPSFDMVTNFGTTEHVKSQYSVWQNIHHFLSVGGVLISSTPYPGDWFWHGKYHPKIEFFEEWCALNNYELKKLYIGESPKRDFVEKVVNRRGDKRRLVRFVGVKQGDDEFRMPSLDTMHVTRNHIK